VLDVAAAVAAPWRESTLTERLVTMESAGMNMFEIGPRISPVGV